MHYLLLEGCVVGCDRRFQGCALLTLEFPEHVRPHLTITYRP
ncbi:hypothetical protein [Mycolicibacterium bacteremicum]|nr:hypothetical protein [Mycolicibacterium bacteremicum]